MIKALAACDPQMKMNWSIVFQKGEWNSMLNVYTCTFQNITENISREKKVMVNLDEKLASCYLLETIDI